MKDVLNKLMNEQYLSQEAKELKLSLLEYALTEHSDKVDKGISKYCYAMARYTNTRQSIERQLCEQIMKCETTEDVDKKVKYWLYNKCKGTGGGRRSQTTSHFQRSNPNYRY